MEGKRPGESQPPFVIEFVWKTQSDGMAETGIAAFLTVLDDIRDTLKFSVPSFDSGSFHSLRVGGKPRSNQIARRIAQPFARQIANRVCYAVALAALHSANGEVVDCHRFLPFSLPPKNYGEARSGGGVPLRAIARRTTLQRNV